MKKEKLINITAAAFLTLTLMTGTAFADTVKELETPDLADLPFGTEKEQDEQESATQNMLITGPVESITTTEDGGLSILVKNDEAGTVFHVAEGVFVIDQNSGQLADVSDIKEGMTISVVLPKNSIMTMSLPPQMPGAVGFVIHNEIGSATVSVFDEDLLSEAKDLKLNISEDTYIIHQNGLRKVFIEEDLKNQELLVLSNIMALSFPAQTAPQVVMILNTEAAPEENIERIGEAVEDSYVALRAAAEEKGFTVVWQGMDAPIELVKGETVVIITLDQTSATVDGEEIQLAFAPKLDETVTVVPQSFIDLLAAL